VEKKWEPELDRERLSGLMGVVWYACVLRVFGIDHGGRSCGWVCQPWHSSICTWVLRTYTKFTVDTSIPRYLGSA
jgi:hypothetical protein